MCNCTFCSIICDYSIPIDNEYNFANLYVGVNCILKINDNVALVLSSVKSGRVESAGRTGKDDYKFWMLPVMLETIYSGCHNAFIVGTGMNCQPHLKAFV